MVGGVYTQHSRRRYIPRVVRYLPMYTSLCTTLVYHPRYTYYTSLGTPCIYTTIPVPAAEYTPWSWAVPDRALGSNLEIVMAMKRREASRVPKV